MKKSRPSVYIKFLIVYIILQYSKLIQSNSNKTATAHISDETLNLILEIFEGRIISKESLPPRSPDLTVCDFYLWRHLKNKVYATNPHTLEELKADIRSEIDSISEDELMCVNAHFLKKMPEMCV